MQQLSKISIEQLAVYMLSILGVIVFSKVMLSYSDLDFTINTTFSMMGLAVVVLLLRYRSAYFFSWQLWLVVALGLTTYLLEEWPRPANHLYVFIYFTLTLVVVFLNESKERAALLMFNFKGLFAVIMVMAVVQKLMTPEYMDGTTNSFWILRGGFFELMAPGEELKTIIASNKDLLNEYYNIYPYSTHKIQFASPIENLRAWALGFNALVIISEIVVLLLFLLSKNEKWKQLPLIALIVLIFITRQESTFLSLLTIVGAVSTKSNVSIRAVYLMLFLILQVTILFEIGFI